MMGQRILALSFVLCTILFHLNYSRKDSITMSGQALHEAGSLLDIAIVSVAYGTLYTEIFGEIVLLIVQRPKIKG